MANMNNKRNRTVRIDEKTLGKLHDFKRDLSSIEKRDIALGEIIYRMSKGEDMEFRLKRGAIERKQGLKK